MRGETFGVLFFVCFFDSSKKTIPKWSCVLSKIVETEGIMISEFLHIIFLLRAAFGYSGVGMWRLKEKDLGELYCGPLIGYLKEQDLNRFKDLRN